MSGKPRKKGGFFITLGLLLIASALGLCCYNVYTSRQAEKISREVLAELESMMPEETVIVGSHNYYPLGENEEPYMLPEWLPAGGEEQLPADETAYISPGEIMYPDYVTAPEAVPPTLSVQKQKYVGVLAFPGLNRSWPVHTDWDYDKLKTAPCRYVGSAYTDDLVLAGHNYSTIFGSLEKLREGDTVTFTDIEGDMFVYEVGAVEIIGPYDYAGMVDTDWDLTLFTCTRDPPPRHRLTVRCSRIR